MLPFSTEQFLEVFRQYNEAIWPLQIVLKVLGAAVAILLLRPRPWSDRFIVTVLALLWVWAGGAYHLWHFRTINPAATVLGGLFLLAALLFALEGVLLGRMRFEQKRAGRLVVGATLIVYALLVYPQVSGLLGHHYPSAPTFGAPCPTTIVTLGVLTFMASPYPRSVLVIPVIWSVLGTVAVGALGMTEDLGLPVAGAAGAAMLARRQTSAWWGRG
jgi:hypothetical protein